MKVYMTSEEKFITGILSTIALVITIFLIYLMAFVPVATIKPQPVTGARYRHIITP